jgi:uncharacterized protein (TIGR02118 family)
MFKFVVLYYQVDDPAALDDFFASTHLRLAEALPGLLRTEVSRVTGKPGGASRFYLMVESYFEDRAAFERALATEGGVELAAALKAWADAKLLAWYYAESFSS